MKKYFVTVVGLKHYFGVKLFERGMDITLIKDTKNEYDKEAIEARLEGLGRVGFVANSVRTVLGETFSAGRIYDKMGHSIQAKIAYIIEERDAIIVEFTK